MTRLDAVLVLCAVALAGCSHEKAVPVPHAKPPARLLPLPRPDDTFSVSETSSVDGRSVSRSGLSTVRWQWAADAPDGTEVLRIEGLRTELWWRSPSGLAVWAGEGWVTIEGDAPAAPPSSPDRGQLRATVTLEQTQGSGDRADGCLRVRLVDREDPAGSGTSMVRSEERLLCPERGETVIERTARSALGERTERLLRR